MRNITLIVLLLFLLSSTIGAFSGYNDENSAVFDIFRNRVPENSFEDPDESFFRPENTESFESEDNNPDGNIIMPEYTELIEDENDFDDIIDGDLIDSEELAEGLSELEDADDRSPVQLFTLENGVIQENDVPDFIDEHDLDYDDRDYDDDVSEDDVVDDVRDNNVHYNDDDGHGIEAYLSDEVFSVKPDLPRRLRVMVKRVVRNKPAVIQILVVVDYSLYKKFLARHKMNTAQTLAAIKQYYTTIVSLANERYSTIHVPGMEIQLVLSNVIVAKDPSDSPWVERIVQFKKRKAVIDAVAGLDKFQKWLIENKDLPPYDFAISFTSYSMLIHGTRPAAGVAQVEGMCSKKFGQSSSLIVDRADYRSGHVVAHEIGHSLGATHDGVQENIKCPYSRNHVMSPKALYSKTTYRNILTFSSCSLTQMRKFLRSPDASCLYDAARPLMRYDLKKSPPGALFSADEQCKMVFGKRSGLCSENSLRVPMCHRLWCKSPEDNRRCRTHDLLYALPGTTCDVNKRCEQMSCVTTQSSQPPKLKTSTKSKWVNNLSLPPSRQKNYKGKVGRPQTSSRPSFRNRKGRCKDRKVRQCNSIIRAKPTLCRRHRVRKSCCQSCARYYKSY